MSEEATATAEVKEETAVPVVEEKSAEVPAKFQDLVSKIEEMSVLDLADLVKVLEEKFGVSAAAPAMMMAAGGDSAGGEEAEEKTEFDVELTEIGGNKISVIKAVRTITGLGLKEAKDIVDSAPKVIKEGVPKVEAEELKKQIEDAGGSAELK